VLDAARPALRTGAVVAQMSTIGPDETTGFSGGLPDGVSYVDSPVAGSIGAVEAGSLTILTGGDPGSARVVLEALGTIVPCGAIGSGAATKLVVNAGMVAALSALRDALAVATAFGVSREAALTALNRGPLAGAVGRATAPPGASSFAMSLAAKDLRLALDHVDSAPVIRAAYETILAESDQHADVATLVSEKP
jgi:3-hydroxyisobutyrate dehydrogenase